MMTSDQMVVHCANCDHTFAVDGTKMPLDATLLARKISEAVAKGCPNCHAIGRGVLLCGPSPHLRSRPPYIGGV